MPTLAEIRQQRQGGQSSFTETLGKEPTQQPERTGGGIAAYRAQRKEIENQETLARTLSEQKGVPQKGILSQVKDLAFAPLVGAVKAQSTLLPSLVKGGVKGFEKAKEREGRIEDIAERTSFLDQISGQAGLQNTGQAVGMISDILFGAVGGAAEGVNEALGDPAGEIADEIRQIIDITPRGKEFLGKLGQGIEVATEFLDQHPDLRDNLSGLLAVAEIIPAA